MRTIAASATIDAPIEKVWSILSDIPRYREWSPFVVDVGGEVKVGELVTLHVAMTPGKAPILQKEKVSKRDEGRELCWGTVMGHPMLLKAERYQRLTAISPSQTRYETADDFEGMLVPIVFALYGAKIQAGFDATAVALKKRAESLP